MIYKIKKLSSILKKMNLSFEASMVEKFANDAISEGLTEEIIAEALRDANILSDEEKLKRTMDQMNNARENLGAVLFLVASLMVPGLGSLAGFGASGITTILVSAILILLEVRSVYSSTESLLRYSSNLKDTLVWMAAGRCGLVEHDNSRVVQEFFEDLSSPMIDRIKNTEVDLDGQKWSGLKPHMVSKDINFLICILISASKSEKSSSIGLVHTLTELGKNKVVDIDSFGQEVESKEKEIKEAGDKILDAIDAMMMELNTEDEPSKGSSYDSEVMS